MENNENIKDINDEDLKFMPLKIENPFCGDKSNWFPLVTLESPNINNFTNNFVFGFSSPMVKGKIDDNFYKSIQYLNDEENYMHDNKLKQSDESYIENNNPSMGYNYESNISPNKAYNSKGNNAIQNCNNLGTNYQEYPKEGYGEELISYEKGHMQNYNKASKEKEENREELPHIKVLREYNFLELDEEDLRGSSKEKINNIFNKIESRNDSILNVFRSYKIPYPMATIIVKKIIKDVLHYK